MGGQRASAWIARQRARTQTKEPLRLRGMLSCSHDHTAERAPWEERAPSRNPSGLELKRIDEAYRDGEGLEAVEFRVQDDLVELPTRGLVGGEELVRLVA